MEMQRNDNVGTQPVSSQGGAGHEGCFITPGDISVPEGVQTLLPDLPTVHLEDLTGSAAAEARVLTAFAVTARDYGRIAHAIRKSPELFLKPLLMLCRESSGRWKSCVDAELSVPPAPTEFEDVLDGLEEIGRRVEKFRALDEHTRVSQLREMQILRYLDSRPDRTIQPTANVHLSDGYDYPLAGALAGDPESTGRDLLESLRETGLVRGKVVDRVHACPSCGDFRLNFREVCPHCGSLVFTEEATLHHFRCSYVGRKSEFQQNEVLRCPKCERRLRHVGVDYDKPRRDFWCGDCGRQFEEPEVECHCLNCRETSPPEDAEIRTFREYEITPDGRLSAQEGSYPETHVADLLRNTPGLYRPRAFEQLYRLELARCQRYEVPATLASLRIENLTELVNGRAGQKLRRLTGEIKELLGGTFRETDLLTDVSRDHILVIFTHTPADEARNALERLDDSLRELVADRIEVESTVFDLREGGPDLEDVKKRSA